MPGPARDITPLPGRFWRHVDRRGPDDCWEWQHTRDAAGYGRLVIWQGDTRTSRLAHRISWLIHTGSLPELPLCLDHLCRNRGCVNPAHLEVVHTTINIRRGVSTSARRHRQTHCIHGHPLSGDNLRIRTNGYRRCVTCSRTQSNRRIQRELREARTARQEETPP